MCCAQLFWLFLTVLMPAMSRALAPLLNVPLDTPSRVVVAPAPPAIERLRAFSLAFKEANLELPVKSKVRRPKSMRFAAKSNNFGFAVAS